MKQLFVSLLAIMQLTFISCNDNKTAKDDGKPSTDVAPAKDTMAPAFQPYTASLIRHKVKDFDKWLSVYDAHDSARKASGLTEITLGRGLDDNNEVTAVFQAADIQKAKDFNSSPGLKEAMQKAGVSGPPTIAYINVIRDDRTPIEQKERIMVAHHVKDFDAWLKVYDGEGKETRAGYGLIDRALGRDADDPNTVYVLFAISDMAKAKARVGSPELKKMMTDAGVDGPPTVSFYRLVR